MGVIHELPLRQLAEELSRCAGLRDFVETGTFEGHALPWAAATIERVWTIEIDDQYLNTAKFANPGRGNIVFCLWGLGC